MTRCRISSLVHVVLRSCRFRGKVFGLFGIGWEVYGGIRVRGGHDGHMAMHKLADLCSHVS